MDLASTEDHTFGQFLAIFDRQSSKLDGFGPPQSLGSQKNKESVADFKDTNTLLGVEEDRNFLTQTPALGSTFLHRPGKWSESAYESSTLSKVVQVTNA